MSKIIHQPNDKFFKKSMESLEVATDFFKAHLPEDILKKIDLSTLKLEKETFIDHAFQSKASDMLYSARLNDSAIYFYLLCEHQSTVDKYMAFRFLMTKIRIMERHQKQRPEENFPLVYPLLIYAGEPPWTAPLDIFSFFGEQEALARSLFLAPYQLIDVCRVPDEILRQRILSGLMEFGLKYREMRHEEAFYDFLMSWIGELTQNHENCTIILSEQVLTYLTRNMENIEGEEYTTFRTRSDYYLSPTIRKKVMTLEQYAKKIWF